VEGRGPAPPARLRPLRLGQPNPDWWRWWAR